MFTFYISVVTTSCPTGGISVPWGYKEWYGKFYKFYSQSSVHKSHNEAFWQCRIDGAHLAVMKTLNDAYALQKIAACKLPFAYIVKCIIFQIYNFQPYRMNLTGWVSSTSIVLTAAATPPARTRSTRCSTQMPAIII